MRFRGLLATVLTISLLALSSWASACDLSCSLQSFHPACQSATAQTEDQETGVMSVGMDMSQESRTDLAEASSDSQVGMVLLKDVSCTHEVCGQASISASAVGTDHGQFKSTHGAAVSAIQLSVNLLRPSYMKTEASPPNISAISPISINLRI